MIKLFVVLVAMVGAYCLVGHYIPQVWSSGFHVYHAYIPWAMVILGGFLVLALRLKSK